MKKLEANEAYAIKLDEERSDLRHTRKLLRNRREELESSEDPEAAKDRASEVEQQVEAYEKAKSQFDKKQKRFELLNLGQSRRTLATKFATLVLKFSFCVMRLVRHKEIAAELDVNLDLLTLDLELVERTRDHIFAIARSMDAFNLQVVVDVLLYIRQSMGSGTQSV